MSREDLEKEIEWGIALAIEALVLMFVKGDTNG